MREQIICRFVEGDVKAFEQIYREYARSMYLMAFGLCQDAHVAEDAVQECFIYLWNNRQRIDSQQSVEGYLHTSVRNYVLNHIRHIKVRQDREEEIVREQKFLLSSDGDEISSKIEYIRQIVDTLPENCRKIFIMSVIEGMSYIDTAQELGISVNTVKSQIKIAYRKIRDKAFENPDDLTLTVLFLLSLKKII